MQYKDPDRASKLSKIIAVYNRRISGKEQELEHLRGFQREFETKLRECEETAPLPQADSSQTLNLKTDSDSQNAAGEPSGDDAGEATQ